MNKLQEALEYLGNSSDQVSQKLLKAGIKGRKMNDKVCPLARYLSSLGFTEVSVGLQSGIDAKDYGCLHTPATHAFVREFDQGMFPALLES